VQLREQAQSIDPRELAADPRRFLRQNIQVRGRALTIEQKEDYTWVHFDAVVVGRSMTEGVVVEYRPKDVRVLRGDCYVFFGVGAGTQTVRITLTGASREVPLVQAYSWDPLPARDLVGCGAAILPQTLPAPAPRGTAIPRV
jgi:hypothetical protein